MITFTLIFNKKSVSNYHNKFEKLTELLKKVQNQMQFTMEMNQVI